MEKRCAKSKRGESFGISSRKSFKDSKLGEAMSNMSNRAIAVNEFINGVKLVHYCENNKRTGSMPEESNP